MMKNVSFNISSREAFCNILIQGTSALVQMKCADETTKVLFLLLILSAFCSDFLIILVQLDLER